MKYLASGALIFNELNELLIVKPVYSNYWHLPGGIVETNESPLQACKREVKEETNLDLRINHLFLINHYFIKEKNFEQLLFIFNGGKLDSNFIRDNIKIPENEIENYKFITLDQIFDHLEYHIAKCISHLEITNNHETLYLEAMERVFSE